MRKLSEFRWQTAEGTVTGIHDRPDGKEVVVRQAGGTTVVIRMPSASGLIRTWLDLTGNLRVKEGDRIEFHGRYRVPAKAITLRPAYCTLVRVLPA